MALVFEALSFPFQSMLEPALLVLGNSHGNVLSGRWPSPRGVDQRLSSAVTTS